MSGLRGIELARQNREDVTALIKRHSAALERITVLERALERISAVEVRADLGTRTGQMRLQRVKDIAQKALDG